MEQGDPNPNADLNLDSKADPNLNSNTDHNFYPNTDLNLDSEADPIANNKLNSNDASNILVPWSLNYAWGLQKLIYSSWDMFLHQENALISWEDDGCWEPGVSKT